MAWCDVFYFEASEDLLEGMSFFLSEDERKRFDRYRIKSAAVNFAVCRGALRKILSGYTGSKPEDIVFYYAESGKPSVNGIEFNMSHSEGSCLIAVSDIPVGIDLERIVERDFDNISKRYFSIAEHKQIMSYNSPSLLFYRSWCMREAFAKLCGRKLSEIMSENYEFDSEKLSLGGCGGVFFSSLPFDGFCSVVCQHEGIPPVLYFPKF